MVQDTGAAPMISSAATFTSTAATPVRAAGMGARVSNTMRNGALLRRVDGLSQKMLTQTVRGLEREGLVARTMYDVRCTTYDVVWPHVEYRLTAMGEDVARLVDQRDQWIRSSVAMRSLVGSQPDGAASQDGSNGIDERKR